MSIPFSRCALPNENASWPYDLAGLGSGGQNLSVPYEEIECDRFEGGRGGEWERGEMEWFEGWTKAQYFEPTSANLSEIPREACPGDFKYDHSEISRSAIDEVTPIGWNLHGTIPLLFQFEIVCGRAWIRAFIQSMYYVGQFLGSIFFGVLGDK